MDDTDDHYQRAEEDDKPHVESRGAKCLTWIRKFFLALIALGLIALLVLQIIIMGSSAEVVAVPPLNAVLADIGA